MYRMNCKVFLVLWILPCLSSSISAEKSPPTAKLVKEWSTILETTFGPMIDTALNISVLQQSYNELKRYTKLVPIDGKEILVGISNTLTTMLQNRKKALQRLVKAAEKSAASHRYRSDLKVADVPFVNVKDLQDESILSYSPSFKGNVSLEHTGVHIPLEVSEGYPEVLNGIKWSGSPELEEAFKTNLQEDPSLKWQYFGSQAGFLRFYPAIKWPDHEEYPDLFDLRRRPWYIQASVSPKDMIVLIDTSGSVFGPTFGMEKAAVQAVLNTLGENDYVNVAWFNNEVGWVVPCLNTLVQGTSQHKKVLVAATNELEIGNYTDYSKALNFAFDAFKEFDANRKDWDGSECHKVVMFISDGTTEYPDDAIERYWNDAFLQDVRVFTIAVGPHPIPTVVLKDMACNTSGHYSTIMAYGSIRTRVKDYVKILSVPLVLSGNEELYHWSNFYQDVIGLGMITTITLPVFGPSDTKSNKSLIGVVGVDVPVSTMVSLTPWESIGPHGYSFAIDQNGFVVFHPYIHKQYSVTEDPPDIDLMYVEVQSPEIEQLRRDMIDRKTDDLLLDSHIIVDEQYTLPIKLKYMYKPVDDSDFSVGLTLPQHQMILKVHGQDGSVGLVKLDPEATLLAPWKYCKKKILEGSNKEIIDQLSHDIKTSYTLCDTHLVQHLLLDQSAIQPLLSYWKRQHITYVHTQYVATDGGITVIHPPGGLEEFESWGNVYNDTVFRMASYAGTRTTFLAVQKLYNVVKRTTKVITIAARVTLTEGRSVFIPAVVGAQLDSDYVTQLFWNSLKHDNNHHWQCTDLNQMVCYLLDAGGFVIASNSLHVQVGLFLGEVDVQLMHGLVNHGAYHQLKHYDFQATCAPAPKVISCGPLHKGFLHWISCLLSWDLNTILQSLSTLIYSVLFTLHITPAESLKEYDFFAPVEEPTSIPCITESARYYSGHSSHVKNGTFQCTGCSRWFYISAIQHTTMQFVVAALPCECESYVPPLPHAAIEDEGPDVCLASSFYRRKPTQCYHRHEMEESACAVNGASDHGFSAVLLLITVALLNKTIQA